MARRLWAGLDIGVETISVCVIDDGGQVLHKANCRTALRDVHHELKWLRRRKFAKVCLEGGVGSTIARGLRTLGYSVDLYEARQLSKFLQVRRNKTDAGDANGIAEAGRVGASLISKVHLKSLECQLLQSRLSIRRHIIRQRVRSVNLLCRQIEHYGGRIAGTTERHHLREKVEPELKRLFGRMSMSLASELRLLLEQAERLEVYERFFDRELNRFARENEVCRRWMEIPGVGPICALYFYANVGDPNRFSKSANIGSYFGLTPKLRQSGLMERFGRISKMGNKETRSALVRSAMSFMTWSKGATPLDCWVREVEKRIGRPKARVALARKLAMIMLAMWKSGERYRAGMISCVAHPVGTPEPDSDPCGEQTSTCAMAEPVPASLGEE